MSTLIHHVCHDVPQVLQYKRRCTELENHVQQMEQETGREKMNVCALIKLSRCTVLVNEAFRILKLIESILSLRSAFTSGVSPN